MSSYYDIPPPKPPYDTEEYKRLVKEDFKRFKKIDIGIKIFQIISIFILILIALSVGQQFKTIKAGQEICGLDAGEKASIYNSINGMYYSEGFYCVVTAGRTTQEIARTEVHEQCHALNHKDYEHFCEGK